LSLQIGIFIFQRLQLLRDVVVFHLDRVESPALWAPPVWTLMAVLGVMDLSMGNMLDTINNINSYEYF
jgi:hypothetical protein